MDKILTMLDVAIVWCVLKFYSMLSIGSSGGSSEMNHGAGPNGRVEPKVQEISEDFHSNEVNLSVCEEIEVKGMNGTAVPNGGVEPKSQEISEDIEVKGRTISLSLPFFYVGFSNLTQEERFELQTGLAWAKPRF